MADPKEDWIDFGKLEKELEAAVEKDARYWRENDAKFRAVEQRVETYEQFRDMVAAAHIKPLDKKDKIGEGKRNQPWNPYTSKMVGPEPAETDDFSRKESNKLPKTCHEFTRDWKSHCKTARERYDLLTSLGAEQLGKMFQAEISFGLLGSFLAVLNEQFRGSDLQCVVDILTSLAKTNRFGLALDFLGPAEREQCTQLFQKLEQECLNWQDRSSQSADSENVPHDLRTGGEKTEMSTDTQQRPNHLEEDLHIKDKVSSLRELYRL